MGLGSFNQEILKSVVGSFWIANNFAVEKGGSNNITGCIKGSVTSFDYMMPLLFFRIWCVANKVDLVIQELIRSVLEDNLGGPFRKKLPASTETATRKHRYYSCPKNFMKVL